MSILTLMVVVASVAVPAQAVCPGDCNGDEVVTVDELVVGVNIALGVAPIENCPAFDQDASRAVEVNELIAAVNAALDGCPIEPIFPADYRATFTEVRDCRLSIEHGGVSIRVLANPIAVEPYLRSDNPLPRGSIIVKEEYDGPDCTNDNELVRWRAMRKEMPGFDPQDADWHWQWVEPDRSVLFDDKTTCISCHREPECLVRDYMCTEGDEPPPQNLNLVLRNLPAALLSISGTSPSDVYAVGADPDDGTGPYVLHYDGERWTRLESGASGDLWWVSVAPIDGDFFLAGSGGLILQFDPAAQTFARHETPGDELLFGIWGASPDDLWAVGGDPADEDAGGVVWHFDGSAWTVEDLSSVRAQGVPTLFKVWGRARDDVYAVGRLGVVLHFDGDGWSEVSSNTIRPLFTVHGNATHTVASGGFIDGVIIERSDGGAFEHRAPPGALQMNGVFLAAGGRGAAVGIEGSVAFRTANGWLLQSPPVDTLRDFHATWIDPEGGVWAVGGELSFDLDDGILAYGGSRTIGSEVR